MDIARAIAFIEEKGSSLEKARFRRLLHGVPPEPSVTLPFTELQNTDGGFPYAMTKGNLSTIDDTLVALWWLDELGMLDSPAAEQATAYLLAVQQDDGGWDEDPALAQYDLPPWISPGDLHARLYLSAYAAYWLAAMGYVAQPALQRALDFLLQHQDERGKFYGYLHTTWIATSVFLMAGQPYSVFAGKGLQVLLDRPLAEWADSQIAWALNCLGKAGLPKGHPLVDKCLAELWQRQRPDGSWSSEDGATFDVGATLGAVKVFKHYGLL
jgi:squalene cyclase